MKKIIFGVSLCSMALFASVGSSVKVPTTEHLKYTFGNHKKHPVQKLGYFSTNRVKVPWFLEIA